MKKEGAFGAATLLAIAAVVGVSLHSGPKPEGSGSADQTSAIRQSKPSKPKPKSRKKTYPVGSACSNLQDQLEDFLDIDELAAPDLCYEPGSPPDFRKKKAYLSDLGQRTSRLKFVIATLPDPVHTHLPVVFDQFTVAIQEGGQDEKYDFDGSWFPWDEEETSYSRLDDEKISNAENELKEMQPGIILFRRSGNCNGPQEQQPDDCEDPTTEAKKDKVLTRPYREGLVVFVVGEEATQGIHRDQFRNAAAWIAALRPKPDPKVSRIAVLGPTFSGSFPSMSQVLSEPEVKGRLALPATAEGQPLAMFSGSVSGKEAASGFQNHVTPQVTFHSFVQDDDEILQRFCNYIVREQHGFEVRRVAIISEDETAYGSSGVNKGGGGTSGKRPEGEQADCFSKALKLYYPRDISALRGAYQTKSLFDAGTSPQPIETQRRNLPTDLADPSGKVHDSIRSYGGNQAPLAQEAVLLQIVAALHELNARYIFLRGSNALDQIFLANFLRRGYPDGRIVIFSSDLMFIRERGATGLGGSMTLSTYPLFPLERDWTEHQSLPASDRVFSSDTAEGTYVAFRLLLNDKSMNDPKQEPAGCHVLAGDESLFLPPIACVADPPIPDYSPPFWMLTNQCGEMNEVNASNLPNKGDGCAYPGPATWLSVIGTNRLWPMASLTGAPAKTPPVVRVVVPSKKDRGDQRATDPGGRPEMPLGMKVFLVLLVVFSFFHAACCWSGSYTAKPAFRAHFASTGDTRHFLLVFGGSCCVACLAIVTAWGCGVFSGRIAGLDYPQFAFSCTALACGMAWIAILANIRSAWKLSQDVSFSPKIPRMTEMQLLAWAFGASGLFVVALVLFYLALVFQLEHGLLPENQVLTYWRAMHLTSGVSPIVPILLVLSGMYAAFWLTLHGLALFGPDRPCLPKKGRLVLYDTKRNKFHFLRMFSQEDAGARIVSAAMPLTWKTMAMGAVLVGLFYAAAYGVAERVPVRSLGAEKYAIIFLLSLDVCCTLAIIETYRLCGLWEELKRLLAFLDRLPLRRTMAALRGFSWGGVWRMSGNVLEVRYKVISRQMECMNHTIASLEELASSDPEIQASLKALTDMRAAGLEFAKWYSSHYAKAHAGDLTSFRKFQKSIASASGTLLAKVLVPAWRSEEESLVIEIAKDEKDAVSPNPPPLAVEKHIQNAEEFVCLNYLGFVQNILGRLRTMTLTIMLLLIVSTVSTSAYPFDPQQALSGVLIVLFVIVGAVIVKVYADMHRDSTLSHVTNTKPGELGSEFWFKIIGFGFAPLAGLLTRIFPSITDFLFTWLQPSVSSLK